LLDLDVESDALLVIWKNFRVGHLVVGSQRTNMRVACARDGYSQVIQREDHRYLARMLDLIQHSDIAAIRVPDEYRRTSAARVSEPFQLANRVLQAVHTRPQLRGT
jgi:hypothetical protein